MLADVIDALRCPVCAGPVELADSVLCQQGHSFDVARQGYVNLLTGAAPPTADTAAMVTARAEFLAAGHYRQLAEAVASVGAEWLVSDAGGLIVDAGAGPGYWLATMLDHVVDTCGLALDSSKYAARRGARAHPRIGAAVCDTWHRLPLADGVAAMVLNVFAPRNAGEFARVLRPGGALVVVTPMPDHLAEAVTALGLLSVDDEKDVRLDRSLAGHFDLVSRERLSVPLQLGTADMRRMALMGPSAWHVTADQLDERLRDASATATTASVVISVYGVAGTSAAPTR